MREDGLRAKKARRFRVTTNSDHTQAIAPNLRVILESCGWRVEGMKKAAYPSV
jgi:hypothetical protein